MKKSSLIACAIGAGIVGYLATVYAVDQGDKTLHQQYLSQANLVKADPLSQQAFHIFNQNGCQYCHTKNSEMPFYADVPVAKQLMQRDIEHALRQFNITALMDQVQNNKPVSQVELAKLESVLNDHAMPPKQFLLMHWRSDLSQQETDTLLNWVKQERTKYYADPQVVSEFKYDAVQPISTTFKVDDAKVKLGEELYHDKRLSGNNTVACSTCHSLTTGGVDHLDTSTGINGAKGPINAPTVFNAVFNIHQFWDGRAKDLQEQAGGPPMNPKEMGAGSWQHIIDKLDKDSALKAQFDALYPKQGISEYSITNAIAEFEKTLVTPNSRFDKFLKGDKTALTQEEQEGYALFKANKCQTCHTGQSMGGLSYEVMGLKGDYFGNRGNVTDVDNGRFNVTKDQNDMHRFKVPTLRNVALTAPYFHDASAKTLEQAVDDMALYQVGVKLSQSDINKITAYLKTLTGEYQGKPLK
ncbi:cytochrome-c peroxidase [Photobacterium lucens]|uniref:cytochrome-c peroxidase n=1 Tax=Photobacterium lucens TaxID=2562949 RepID=UPI0006B4C989|nr:cytochrome-c peroxidase [Photobacterium lucens]KPA53178.1 cytochrome C peroxidase [Photobacterium leiognathi subsp. mandapamensis]MBP2699869.1 c-type cytochrome [Vibrio parahaemolyticus]MZG57113.1 c-type cytochrome [Photobacterium lucens]MZG82668.1 c-type cytochrome [Photobacterium lucens]